MSSQIVPTDQNQPEFVKGLGLFSATAIVMGSMVGSGIFIVSADMSRTMESPALLIAAWLVTAIMTIIAALSYGELAAMMPKAGGQYVYLREALGPVWGFLYGWTLFLVIQSGTIACRCAFGKFLACLCLPFRQPLDLAHCTCAAGCGWADGAGQHGCCLSTANLAAIIILTLLTILNTLGVKLGALIRTSSRRQDCCAADGGGTWPAGQERFGDRSELSRMEISGTVPDWVRFIPVQVGAGGPTAMVGFLTVIAVVQVDRCSQATPGNNVTFTAGEITHPKRNLPLSLALGTGVVLALYIACNFIYLAVLPLHGSPEGTTILARGIQFASEDRVATAVMEQAFAGYGARIMALAVMISTFGCANGMLLSGGPRVLHDEPGRPVLQGRRKLSPKSKTPVVSLWVQWGWTCFLCLSGSYGQLLDYVVVAVLIFYILTIVALFVLRPHATGRRTALQGDWLPGAAGPLHRDGDVRLCCTLTL